MPENKPSINNFDILKEMSARNLDIRACDIGSNLVNIKRVKGGGHITLGIDSDTTQKVMDFAVGVRERLLGVLIVADGDQFDEVRKELENA